MSNEQKRKTYSLDHKLSRKLAIHAIKMGENVGRVVARQEVLDVLVKQLDDKKFYQAIVDLLKSDDR